MTATTIIDQPSVRNVTPALPLAHLSSKERHSNCGISSYCWCHLFGVYSLILFSSHSVYYSTYLTISYSLFKFWSYWLRPIFWPHPTLRAPRTRGTASWQWGLSVAGLEPPNCGKAVTKTRLKKIEELRSQMAYICIFGTAIQITPTASTKLASYMYILPVNPLPQTGQTTGWNNRTDWA